jgi:uncharacterized membrane protein HdeD (DUF308 family)
MDDASTSAPSDSPGSKSVFLLSTKPSDHHSQGEAMSSITATSPATTFSLQRLYFARFGFALIWAGLFATTHSSLGAFAAALLILYPVVDVLAAAIDARSTNAGKTKATPVAGLYVNIAISTAAAVGLALAATDDIAAVMRVWGAWAVVAGLVQLVVASSRRSLGGQGAMIASGGLSVLVGASIVLSAPGATTMVNLAGYAVVGGIFFLVSAWRLGRVGRISDDAVAV